MGRKSLFTQEQVFEKADMLVAQGKEVTATALLVALKGGSLTTIYKHLAAWQESRTEVNTQPGVVEIPDSVQGAFIGAWRMAVAEANKEVVAIRERTAEELKVAHKHFDEALEQIARLEAEGEADSEQIESLFAKVAELEAEKHRAESERAAERATSTQLQEQIKNQEEELEQLRQEKDKFAAEAAELRGHNRALTEQNKELLNRLPEPKKGKEL